MNRKFHRPETIGDVIAERRLSVLGLPELKVIIQLGKPRDAEELFIDGKEASDAFCPFRILGIGDEQIHYAVGIDGIQALQLVMKAITAEVAVLSKRHEYTFRWLDDSDGDLGFPGIGL